MNLTNLILFCREKNMSTVTKVISPMLRRPKLSVSGFNIRKHNLHCFVKISTSMTCSILIRREWSSFDFLFFFVTGDKMMLQLGHLSWDGRKVLGHPSLVRVSLALQCLMELKMDLSGILSFRNKYLAVFCMYFCVLEQFMRWTSQCSSLTNKQCLNYQIASIKKGITILTNRALWRIWSSV